MKLPTEYLSFRNQLTTQVKFMVLSFEVILIIAVDSKKEFLICELNIFILFYEI